MKNRKFVALLLAVIVFRSDRYASACVGCPKLTLRKGVHMFGKAATVAFAGLLLFTAAGYAQSAAGDAAIPANSTIPPKPVGSDDISIRPFHFNASDEALADLRRRIAATRWPENETVSDESQGVRLATMQALARYWATDYDWHKCEAKLRALPQFVTTIDGLDIHFIHVRSKSPNALPVIITHGWPGSIIEQLKIIGPLTDPTAYGGKAEDAFDVVIPSLP